VPSISYPLNTTKKAREMKEVIDVAVIKNSGRVAGTKVIEEGYMCDSHINSVAH